MGDCPSPGIYDGVPFEEYLAWGAMSNSRLGNAARSLAHFRWAEDNGPSEPTPAMRFGTLTHEGKFEPLVIPQKYVVMPDFSDQVRTKDGERPKNPKATADYKRLVAQFCDVNADKEIVTQDDYDRMVAMTHVLQQNPKASAWLSQPGLVELAIVWDDPETGRRCKARLDHCNPTALHVTDLKTTQDVQQFEKSLANYGYYRQAAFYLDGLAILTGRVWTFGFVAIEKEPPYCCRSAVISDAALYAGRCEYRRLLREIEAAAAMNCWPGPEDPDTWQLPTWAAERVTLTVSGNSIEL